MESDNSLWLIDAAYDMAFSARIFALLLSVLATVWGGCW